jgi:GT2 family glycosyltransferase
VNFDAEEKSMLPSPWMADVSRIAVLITCFNRKQKTIACIDAVMAQSARDSVVFDFYVTDDASCDGTAELLLSKYPSIRLCHGNGSLFWNGGMRLAWQEASQGRHDFYLWLNDDTFLYRDAVRNLLAAHGGGIKINGQAGIVVGATEDHSGRTSYSGERQKNKWLLPLTLTRLAPNGQLQSCDTFNGNCVLVPLAAAEALGNLDSAFLHAMGDTDYGLRARRLGVPIWLAPYFVGRCVNDNDNDNDNESGLGPVGANGRLSLLTQWKNMFAPKALPWRPWKILCRRHAGILWPVYWLWPYLKMSLTLFFFRKT